MKIDRQCPKCRYRCHQTVYPDVPSALGANSPGYVVAQCNGGLACHHTWRARLTPSEREEFDSEQREYQRDDLEAKRLRGFYWIKGSDGWEPAEWDPEHGGWFPHRTTATRGYDDEDVGEIGPMIQSPEDARAAIEAMQLQSGGVKLDREAVAKAVADYQISVGLDDAAAWEDAHGIADAILALPSAPAKESALPREPHDHHEHRGLEMKATGGRLSHVRVTGSRRDD